MAADILDILLTLQSRFDSFDDRMNRLESAMLRNGVPVHIPAEPLHDHDERPESAESAPPTVEDADSLSPGDTAGAQVSIDSVQARTITRDMEEEKEVEPGPVVRPGAPSIPHNHTTLAAFLLKWPSISILVGDMLEAENVKYVDEFPISQEQKRGLLRVWGRGEGIESSLRVDKADREALRDAGVMEMVLDDFSDTGAPSPADCWGGIGGSPAPIDGKPVVALQTPDFSESLVWKYVKSFQDNIQNMHPLVFPQHLKAMVRVFLDTVQQSMSSRQSRGGGGIAKFVSTPSSQSETGSKRKRSPAPDGAESPSVSPKTSKPAFQRSINNALVLLVLALGKICLHKDRIPDVVPVSEPPPHSSPLARNGYPASPIQGSSPSHASHSHSAGHPSPKDGVDRPGPSRRSSFQGGGGVSMKGGTSLKRNLDVIPGLEYFAYATDILGGQLAGFSMRHIHAFLLAGLYHGQLGRVLESYAYIKEAAFALQVKMRPRLDRFTKLLHQNIAVTDEEDNQILFAFWTCLQLESDIIAELPLPQSQILTYEDMMPYPNIHVAERLGFDQHVLHSYLAQLYLRKRLNEIHSNLYNPEKPRLNASGVPNAEILAETEGMLKLNFLAPQFMFEFSDPPAGDILSARIRAKYWGARVITYRFHIRRILELNFQSVSDHSAMAASGFSSDNAITPEMIGYAVKGVMALIESTRAFHGLKEKRFVVTNIFGTAHAQWGNLLTLAAVFRDPTLQGCVDEQLLKELFSKTIAFFRIIAPPTSALHVDLRILEGVERKLWGRSNNAEVMDHPTGSSFSSTTSGGPPPVPPLIPAPSMPPVAGPHGIRSPVSRVSNGMISMSPPLPSPLPAPILGAGGVPVPAYEPVHGPHPGMLPPMQHQPPHH